MEILRICDAFLDARIGQSPNYPSLLSREILDALFSSSYGILNLLLPFNVTPSHSRHKTTRTGPSFPQITCRILVSVFNNIPRDEAFHFEKFGQANALMVLLRSLWNASANTSLSTGYSSEQVDCMAAVICAYISALLRAPYRHRGVTLLPDDLFSVCLAFAIRGQLGSVYAMDSLLQLGMEDQSDADQLGCKYTEELVNWTVSPNFRSSIWSMYHRCSAVSCLKALIHHYKPSALIRTPDCEYISGMTVKFGTNLDIAVR
jgi:hypothetical protein